MKIRIKIREELLYRIMIGTYLSLTLDSIRKIVSIVYSFEKDGSKMERPAWAGESVARKKNANFS